MISFAMLIKFASVSDDNYTFSWSGGSVGAIVIVGRCYIVSGVSFVWARGLELPAEWSMGLKSADLVWPPRYQVKASMDS